MEFVRLPKFLVEELFDLWKRVRVITPTVSEDLKQLLTQVQDKISQLKRQSAGLDATDSPSVQPMETTGLDATDSPSVQPMETTGLDATDSPSVQPMETTGLEATDSPSVQPMETTEATELPKDTQVKIVQKRKRRVTTKTKDMVSSKYSNYSETKSILEHDVYGKQQK
ncbi:hypothetical protein ACROYT_G026867 [Oculina patagonica]